MFARTVSIKLKPNTLTEFNQTFVKEIMPLMHKQAGFRDEIAYAGDDGLHLTAVSLWDNREQAEAYNTSAYPGVLKTLDKYLDGAPRVRVGNVFNSTSHKIATAVAAA